jgi:hypothetical protein
MPAGAQTTPRRMSGHWFDVEIRGTHPLWLECLLDSLAGLMVQALQVADSARSGLTLLRGSVIYDDPTPCSWVLLPGAFRVQLRKDVSG